MFVFIVILLIVLFLFAIFSIPLGIPGTFIILGISFFYALATRFQIVNGTHLLILLVLALFAEGVEAVAGIFGAKKFGASRMGMFMAVIGGIGGALFGSLLLPLIGTVIGAFLGTFIGAFIGEWHKKKDLSPALRAGTGAFLGRFGAVLAKIMVASFMVVFVLRQIFQAR